MIVDELFIQIGQINSYLFNYAFYTKSACISINQSFANNSFIRPNNACLPTTRYLFYITKPSAA